MPGRPPIVVYVRTFSSGNRESHGSGGPARGCAPTISNGVMSIQADPSYVSIGIVRNQGSQRRRGDRPVGEQHVDPALAYDPRPARQLERAVIHSLERCALASGGGGRRRHMAPWT
jgi:hypothetical protein